jgi:hypothetical protein
MKLDLSKDERPTSNIERPTSNERKSNMKTGLVGRNSSLVLGWVEPGPECWISSFNPAYENQAFNLM